MRRRPVPPECMFGPVQVQGRISEAVARKFGVTDEQVMAAVDYHGAKQDPSFKDILQRIATTLSSSLG